MNTNIIQAQYEQLDNIADRFGNQAETNADLYNRVQQGVQALQQGGWEGEGVEAFVTEMDGEVFPAMQRLTGALEEAQSVTLDIKNIIQQAEEEAASLFAGAGQGVEIGSGIGGGGMLDVPITPISSSQLPITRSPNAVFNTNYMDSFVNTKIRGEDSQRLNNAMEALYKNPTGAELDRVLTEIADIRGVPVEDIKAGYERFQVLKQEAAVIAAQNGKKPPEAINQFFHDDFMGSTAQLRYGKIVGDVLGIDPVFGAMLNPTGGMVGPGNWAYNPGDDTVLGYHGEFHDAAGYLYNHHNLGPGYNYLGQEDHRDPGNPLTGQQSGVRYWEQKLNPGLVTDIKLGVADFVINTTETTIDAVDTAIDTGVGMVKDFGDQVGDFIGDTSDALTDGTKELLDYIF